MSWKNLVYAGMFCALLAVPAMAQPTITIDLVRDGGGLPMLDSNGDWQWVVQVVPDENMFTDPADDNPDRGTGGSVALEGGVIASDAALLGAVPVAANFPEDNPGAAITGVTAAGPGVTTDGNTLTAFLGSEFFNDNDADPNTDEPRDAVIITTEGPSTDGTLGSTLDLVGAHGGGARVAQAAQNFDGNTLTIRAEPLAGDFDLSGGVGGLDLAALADNFNLTGNWHEGDATGDGNIGGLDLAALADNFNLNQAVISFPGSGAGLGGGSSIPEPSSLMLIVLGGMLAALRFRR